MSRVVRLCLLAAALLGLGLVLTLAAAGVRAQDAPSSFLLSGAVFDEQGQPVVGAHVTVVPAEGGDELAAATTQANGHYALDLEGSIPDTVVVRIERAHFRQVQIELDAGAAQRLRAGEAIALPDTVLPRRISAAFWVATATFLAVLGIMASGRLHNTLAALVGVAIVLGVSYLLKPLWGDLYIFDFGSSLRYVDWNVIFLIMGMMIVIAVVERTGIFQWLAFQAYRISGGRLWLLLTILMLIAGVASAFLDNVTTMLLMTPITVQIALALDINPLALLMPEVMASNVAGVSTLVGTPTNILIGSYADISFNSFLGNLTPGVLLALLGLVVYSQFVYRRDLRSRSEGSNVLLLRLSEQARITEPANLKKAGWVGLGMLLLFVFGETVHLMPAVTALIGATVLLLWIRPDVEEMIEAVDWTTLVFFIALFVVVGAVQEVGLISLIAGFIGELVGGSLVLAMIVVVWLSALLSTVVANIPFTAAMLPIVGYLTGIVPGAGSNALFYCLSVGSAMGGNGSLIGASANLVTVGISDRAGFPISYGYFLKKGFPAVLITVSLATVWLLIRFLVIG
jgi:Na+/H+ antiporter NhaD/arsenite permease-like protein